MPKIIEIMAANESPTYTERWNLSLRIDLLNTQVDEFNKNISESGWITFLHVILCILTLGLFSRKSPYSSKKWSHCWESSSLVGRSNGTTTLS